MFLPIGGFDAQQPAQQVVAHLDLRVDLGQGIHGAEHLAHKSVGARERRVDERPNTNQAARHRILQVVLLSKQREDACEERHTPHSAVRAARDDARADLNLLPELEHALQDRAARHAAAQVLHLLPRFVDIKRADHDHLGCRGEVAHRDRDVGGDVLGDDIDVVAQLRRDGYHRRRVGHRPFDERFDILMLLQRGRFLDKIDLVLQDDDVLQLHDLDGGEVFGGLRLRARLVARDQQQRRVHHRRTVEHGRHENVVAWAVNERHVPHELVRPLALRDHVLRGRAARNEVPRPRALWVFALVDLGVRVAQLDGDVALELVLEAHGVHSGDGLDDGGFAVSHVADGACGRGEQRASGLVDRRGEAAASAAHAGQVSGCAARAAVAHRC